MGEDRHPEVSLSPGLNSRHEGQRAVHHGLAVLFCVLRAWLRLDSTSQGILVPCLLPSRAKSAVWHCIFGIGFGEPRWVFLVVPPVSWVCHP